jgi:putative hemolysin
MEIAIFAVLVALNSFFSLTEMSVIASNRTRLRQWAESGRSGAAAALHLASSPTRFLSVVQTGITAVGVCSGALGESTFAAPFRSLFQSLSLTHSHTEGLSLAAAIIVITLAQLLLGELIPKRVALINPERFACLLAPVMNALSRVLAPAVWLLESITHGFLRMFRVNPAHVQAVTEEEILVLMTQGAEAGAIEGEEHAIVHRVFSLDDQSVRAIMTPRADIRFIDIDGAESGNLALLQEGVHSYLPVCKGGPDEILGVIRASTACGAMARGERLDYRALMEQPLYVPQSVNVMELLATFKAQGQYLGLVVDEYGAVEGLVSLHDIMEALVGEIESTSEKETPDFVQLQDGTWLVDGSVSVGRLKEVTQIDALDGESEGLFHTLAGLVMTRLGRVPSSGDAHVEAGWRFEVASMNRQRVDKLTLTRLPEPTF